MSNPPGYLFKQSLKIKREGGYVSFKDEEAGRRAIFRKKQLNRS